MVQRRVNRHPLTLGQLRLVFHWSMKVHFNDEVHLHLKGISDSLASVSHSLNV